MHLDYYQKYLITINILSFCIFTVDFVLYLQNGKGIKIRWLCDVITIIGGSAGTLLAFLFWDRRVVKQNSGWRFFTISLLIIHIVIYLYVYGIINDKINLVDLDELLDGIIAFAKNHLWFWYYLLLINIITFVSFAIDKVRAIRDGMRIREFTLLSLCLIGGSIGGIIAVYTMRHKIHSSQFTFGIPMIMVAQLAALSYWIVRSL